MPLPVQPLIRLGAIFLVGTGVASLVGSLLEEIMASNDATYVIFDGDRDQWAYRYMKGWNVNENMNFDFKDAHDIGSMTSRAQDEAYVKSELRKRMSGASQVIVLVGESTKDLRKFVPWEIDLAIEKNLPVIVVNLNDKRAMDPQRCPVALRNLPAVHVNFKAKIIKHALDHWPSQHRGLTHEQRLGGAFWYGEPIYKSLGL